MEREKSMTYKRAAQDALACQDACNLSGVARTLLAREAAAAKREKRKVGKR